MLPTGLFATMKNVPDIDVPPVEIMHADDAKSPPGFEDIVQVTESPLLNCPELSSTRTVAPTGPILTGERPLTRNTITG